MNSIQEVGKMRKFVFLCVAKHCLISRNWNLQARLLWSWWYFTWKTLANLLMTTVTCESSFMTLWRRILRKRCRKLLPMICGKIMMRVSNNVWNGRVLRGGDFRMNWMICICGWNRIESKSVIRMVMSSLKNKDVKKEEATSSKEKLDVAFEVFCFC